MDQQNDYNHNDFMMPENHFPFTPLPFQSPHMGAFTQLNLPPIDDKLNLEYSSLLNPETKDVVINKIDQYNEAGRAFINALQYHNAQKIYELILEAQPKNEKAAVLLGKCLQMNEEYLRAIFFLRYAMELNDKLKVENYTQAEQNFKHCLKVDSGFSQRYTVYLYLGIINKYNLQYKISIEYFLMNLQDPQTQNTEKASLTLINIGQCLESFQEYDEAASCYNKSLCLTPGNFIALKAISWLFFQNGKIVKYLNAYLIDYNNLFKIRLNQRIFQYREIFYMQARCLEQLGKHKEAMQAVSQAIQAEPNNPDNYTLLGVVFNKLNMHQESFQAFQRAYQMDTSKIENLFNMALIYEVAKKYTDALKLYSKLLLLDPQDCIVLQRKACIESSNYQNLTEYQQIFHPQLFNVNINKIKNHALIKFEWEVNEKKNQLIYLENVILDKNIQFQMRYPNFKPSAQLWWIENLKQQKYNVLHEISGVSLFNNNQQINEKIEHVEGPHSIFDHATKKASLLSQGNGKSTLDNDDIKSSASFNKGINNQNIHKNSINTNFNNAFLQQNQFARSRNSSFNCKIDDNAHDNTNGQNGGGLNKLNNVNNILHQKLSTDILNPMLQGANRKDSSMDITALQRRALNQQYRNKLFSTDQGGENNAIFEKKEENENYSFSNSPKKDDKNRKESDLFYEQTRRNSLLNNLGAQYHHFQYGYNPFNNGPIAKDSMDFGYNINNYYGDQMDTNGNPSDFGGNRQKKSSIIGHMHNQYNNNNKNLNKNDNQIFQ